MKSLIFFNALFGFFTIIAFLSSLVLIYLIFFRRKNLNIPELRDFALIYASLVALVSTTGSLIYSEVIGFIPCRYCWYQRYVMYPLAALLIYVVIKKKFIRLAGLYAGLGGAFSIYHIYTQNGGGSGGSCSIDVPCSLKYVEVLNFISIPVMALAAFTTIVLSLMYYELTEKVNDE
tara:strand:+ start:143 stop:670 length:528 start_codon:yes stop_codon:yes gene_type:complete